ncbi:MAG: hypothetical protein WBA00_07655 [Rhodococcus sp. (in: high G+C Gram-positive bacteria)]
MTVDVDTANAEVISAIAEASAASTSNTPPGASAAGRRDASLT